MKDARPTKKSEKTLVKTFSMKSFQNIYENLLSAKKPEETYKKEIKTLM